MAIQLRPVALGSLADRVGSIVWAFGTGDERRAAIRALAAEVWAMESRDRDAANADRDGHHRALEHERSVAQDAIRERDAAVASLHTAEQSLAASRRARDAEERMREDAEVQLVDEHELHGAIGAAHKALDAAGIEPVGMGDECALLATRIRSLAAQRDEARHHLNPPAESTAAEHATADSAPSSCASPRPTCGSLPCYSAIPNLPGTGFCLRRGRRVAASDGACSTSKAGVQ